MLSVTRILISTQDEVRFLRIRTKRHEIMISPGALSGILSLTTFIADAIIILDDKYLLAVLHDPAS